MTGKWRLIDIFVGDEWFCFGFHDAGFHCRTKFKTVLVKGVKIQLQYICEDTHWELIVTV